jgi:hypothetical protein
MISLLFSGMIMGVDHYYYIPKTSHDFTTFLGNDSGGGSLLLYIPKTSL